MTITACVVLPRTTAEVKQHTMLPSDLQACRIIIPPLFNSELLYW